MASSSGEVVAITGVSRGLGLAMSRWYIKSGHTVIGCARSSEQIEKLNEELGPAEKYKFTALDITDEVAVQKWVKQSVETFGPPSLLINNAGVTNNNEKLWKVPRQEFDKVIDVNIKGTTNVLRHFVPAMIDAKRRAVIVNLTSGWCRCVAPEVAPYCASKWALEGLSKALAMELPDYITCVPVNPGVINTRMLQTSFGYQGASVHESPESWAKRACPYLLSIKHDDNGRSLTC